MNLSRKITLVIGILILVTSLVLGLVSVKLSSDALLSQNKEAMLQYSEESASYIDSIMAKNLAVLNEVATRARTATMDWTIQKESLYVDVERLGYLDLAVVRPDGIAQYVVSGETADLSDREYIKKAFAGETNISDVLISKVTGEPVVMEAAPIKSNGTVVGVLIGRRDGNFLSGITNELGTGERGYALILGSDSTIYAHPNKDEVINQTNVFEKIETDGESGMGGQLKELGMGTLGMIEYTREGNAILMAMAPIPNTDWTLAVGNYKSDVTAGITKLSVIIIVIALIVVGCGVAAAIFMGNVISKPIRNLRSVADKMALGEVDVEVNATTKDEIGDLMISFGKMIENTKNQAEAGERIANGDLSVEIAPRSDKDVLAISMKAIVDNLNSLVDETKMLTAAAAEGDLTTRGKADAFQGGFKEIVEGINETLDGIVDPLSVALVYIEKMANGEDLEELENNYKGQYGVLINYLLMVRESLYTLLSQTADMTKAAFAGDFSYKPEMGILKGGYAQIIQSVSEALACIIAPLVQSGEYMKQIGNGEIPEKITEEYRGDFNEIKTSINDCIDGLGGLVEGREILGRMSANDYTAKVEGSYLGIYSEIAGSINAVSDRVRNVILIMDHIASGDLGDLKALNEVGKRSENDTLMPAMIKMIENIQSLINEATMLTDAVVEGKLDTQSDSSVFDGAWKNLVDGMNNILVEVAKPLKDVTEVMNEISSGNLNVAVKGSYKGDFDQLSQSVNTTAKLLNIVVGEITQTIVQIAEGNLALDHVREFRGDFVSISNSLNVIIDSLNTVMGDINEAAEQVSAGSIQVSEGSQTLSQGSTEQASSIQELTASITEIASQTKQNAVNANQASDLATTAKNNAEKGNGQMGEMLKSMEDISESSNNISKIIKVIDDIAFQTNILALNAAVEAARAGQHGKGFAVVAEEVRSLAARSADAAKDTTALIEGSISRVQVGTKIANETASALDEIVTGVEKVANLVGNIATASNEQATGITQINRGLEQVSQVVQNNSATAEESAAASEELSGQAELLKEMVGKFKLNQVKKSLLGLETRMLGEGALKGSRNNEEFMSEPKILLGNDEFDKY